MENYDIMVKLWHYGQNCATILRTIELRFTKEKKHGRLPKTKKLWFIMEKKPMVIHQNNWTFLTEI